MIAGQTPPPDRSDFSVTLSPLAVLLTSGSLTVSMRLGLWLVVASALMTAGWIVAWEHGARGKLPAFPSGGEIAARRVLVLAVMAAAVALWAVVVTGSWIALIGFLSTVPVVGAALAVHRQGRCESAPHTSSTAVLTPAETPAGTPVRMSATAAVVTTAAVTGVVSATSALMF